MEEEKKGEEKHNLKQMNKKEKEEDSLHHRLTEVTDQLKSARVTVYFLTATKLGKMQYSAEKLGGKSKTVGGKGEKTI